MNYAAFSKNRLRVKLTCAPEEKCEHNNSFLLNNLIDHYVLKLFAAINAFLFEINKTRKNVNFITPAPLARR